MDELLQDLRFALRFLMRNKRSTGIAILCLSTGIAMTTSTFSAVNPWVFRALPWRTPERLVAVDEIQRETPEVTSAVSASNYRDWVRESGVSEGRGPFAEIGAFERANFSTSAADEPEWVLGARVGAGVFSLFDEKPILGRAFVADEDVLGKSAVVILGHELWSERFAADPGVIGRTMQVDGRPHEIVGVMREGFRFPEWGRLWTPLGLSIDAPRDERRLSVVARLRADVSIEQAQAELDRISASLEQRFPIQNAGWWGVVRPYRDQLSPAGVRLGLSIQLFAAIFVLLIACANAANILLAQATFRGKEIALRSALGASRSRIVRQLLSESLLIAVVAGGLGSLAAPLITRALLGASPIEPPYWVFMGVDYQVLLFTLAICVVTGVAVGLVPALRASRVDLIGALKEGGRSATRSVRSSRLAQGLVAAELALSIVLLIGASLLIRSYLAIGEVDLGYDRDGVLTWQVALTSTRYPDAASRAEFVREAVRRARAIPGVESAGAVNFLPATDEYALRAFEVEGRPVPRAERPSLSLHPVTDGYLETLRIGIVEGRAPSSDEVENRGEVILVSQSLAERLWPGRSAIGQRLRFDEGAAWLRVIGVTRDISPPFDVIGAQGSPRWQAWVPFTYAVPETVGFALRVWGEPAGVAPAVRAEFRALDASLPVYEMLSMNEVLLRVTWVSRLWGIMFASFAVFALLLSSVGLYGVISYGVAQRTHEVGVRLALGARPRDVLALVMRQGLWATAVGTAAGLALAIALGFALSRLLFGVETRDPITFVGTTCLLASVSLLATFFPALRATRVDPVVALRSG
jgi:putative ABC transport system permease protein